MVSADFKQEGEIQTAAKRETKSIRLSRFAAHNAFHHCEQCHRYCEAGPATQVSAVCRLRHSSAALSQTYTYTHLLYTLTYQNTLILESFLLFAVMPNGILSVLIMHLCVCYSCRSAPSMLSPSALPCWGKRSSSSLSFPKPRSSTLSSVSRAAT